MSLDELKERMITLRKAQNKAKYDAVMAGMDYAVAWAEFTRRVKEEIEESAKSS